MKKHLALFAILSLPIIFAAFTFSSEKASALEVMFMPDQYGPKGTALVITPALTYNAYQPGGFYDYYSGKCDSCLTAPISLDRVSYPDYASGNAISMLKKAGYDTIPDYTLHYYLLAHPDYLESYQTVILLHNEYATQEIYDAVQSHPHVIYLYPNALYGMVTVSHWKMTLVRGHDYAGLKNGFGWKDDNSKNEYDRDCNAWNFTKVSNGYQLSCYPETKIIHDLDLLKKIREL